MLPLGHKINLRGHEKINRVGNETKNFMPHKTRLFSDVPLFFAFFCILDKFTIIYSHILTRTHKRNYKSA